MPEASSRCANCCQAGSSSTMPKCGIVLELPAWQELAQRLEASGMEFVLKPQVRFEGLPGEQWTMFFCDPFGNPIEAKGFRSLDTVYDA